MAGFKTHLATGIAAGALIAAAGTISKALEPAETGAVLIVGAIGGLLPDMDSDTGKPLALLFQLISVLVPTLMYPFFKDVPGSGTPFLICYFTLFYLFLNNVVCPVVKKLTVHRGIMHSIPFAVVCGETAFILFDLSGRPFAWYGGAAVFTGCMVHLIVDELHAISLKNGIMPVFKRSTGSALKLSAPYPSSMVLIYLLLTATSIVIYLKFYPLSLFS